MQRMQTLPNTKPEWSENNSQKWRTSQKKEKSVRKFTWVTQENRWQQWDIINRPHQNELATHCHQNPYSYAMLSVLQLALDLFLAGGIKVIKGGGSFWFSFSLFSLFGQMIQVTGSFILFRLHGMRWIAQLFSLNFLFLFPSVFNWILMVSYWFPTGLYWFILGSTGFTIY